MILNRREVAKKWTMELFKEQKIKNRCVNKEKGKNDYGETSTWTAQFYKDI